MLIAGLSIVAIIAWCFGYLYAKQSIQTQIFRSYTVTVKPPTNLRVIK